MTSDSRRFAAIGLAEGFWGRLWDPTQDIREIGTILTPDATLSFGGRSLVGIEALLDWMETIRSGLEGARVVTEETFASVDASRVCSRWALLSEATTPASAPLLSAAGVSAAGAGATVLEASPAACMAGAMGIGVWRLQWDGNAPRLHRGWLEQSAPPTPAPLASLLR